MARSSSRPRRFRASRSPRPRLLEWLEPRVLLSTLPNESTLVPANFSDEWWIDNTGQTLSSFDPTYGHATGNPGADISAPAAWDLTTGSRNVVVAVLDTGIDLAQPDLISSPSNIFLNPKPTMGDVNGWNFVTNSADVQDTTGHGTSVAGVIGAVGNNGIGVVGVDWHVSILPVVVGDASGVTPANLIAGINYVVSLKKEGINIVCINSSYADFSLSPPSSAEIAAIAAAGNAGIMYVQAAGNAGTDISALNLVPGWSSLNNVITVAATDNRDTLAAFSDYSSTVVQLGAPGVDILTTVPTVLGGVTNPNPYAFLSGTSYAAPMVSGAVALLAAESPSATMAQIRTAILLSVDPDPSLAGKTVTGGRLDIAKALQALIGDPAPFGYLDSISPTSSAQGWAFDFNAGVNPVTITTYVDGTLLSSVTANLTRTDLLSVVGSTQHGFSVPLAGLLPFGTHTITIDMLNVPTGAPTLLYQGSITRVSPIGYVDVFTAARVAGWAFDSGAGATPINVQVLVDGVFIMGRTANLTRNDLTPVVGSPDHGFDMSFTGITPGTHTISVYAFDNTYHDPFLIGQRVINVPAPIGYVDSATTSQISGWAIDPGSPTTSISVRVDIDGVQGTPFVASLTRNDLIAPYGSANHGFTYTYPALPLAPGFHRIDVYAIDATTSTLTLLTSKTIDALTPPIGWVDTISTTTVSGWAFSADAPVANVRILIDGVQRPDLVANAIRNDLTPVVGSPGHGFTYTMPQLTVGTHTVAVYAIDPENSNLVLIGSGSVTVAANPNDKQPTGYVDSLTTTNVSGWAYSSFSGTGAVSVRIDVDGTTVVPPTPASLTRNDLTSVVGSANHGYSFALSLAANASHVVDIYYIDPQSSTPILFSSQLLGATAPRGWVDSFTLSTISGWAFDADYGPTAINVRLDVDGMVGALATASDLRNDLTPVIGSPNHGFTITTPFLAPGKHTLVIRAVDPYTLATVILATATLTFT